MPPTRLACLAAAGLGGALALWACAAAPPAGAPAQANRSASSATRGAPFGLPASALPPPGVTRYRVPPPPRGAKTGLAAHDGSPVVVACATCHATRTPDATTRQTAQLDLFHQGLAMRHGTSLQSGGLACLSCHDREDYGRLHLADGSAVPFGEAMQLCAQCHGPQWRDYQHGVHGGMNGHIDLRQGGRVRNTCTSCHDPHAPAYIGTTPLPPPRDRFQTPPPAEPARHD